MKNPCWQAVVIALVYFVQFDPKSELYSPDGRRRLFNLVWFRNIYPFSVDDTRRALKYLERHEDIDISGFIPQPHSNKTLRKAFAHLYRTLDKLPV